MKKKTVPGYKQFNLYRYLVKENSFFAVHSAALQAGTMFKAEFSFV